MFAGKTSRMAAVHEAEVKTLHAKIGQLTVDGTFQVSTVVLHNQSSMWMRLVATVEK